MSERLQPNAMAAALQLTAGPSEPASTAPGHLPWPAGAGRAGVIEAHWSEHGSRCDDVAAAAGALWRVTGAALAPIIGERGVWALYARSLHVTAAAHPALAPVFATASVPGDYAALQAALASCTATDAGLINAALLAAFNNLLASLIGHQLTDRLLDRAVLDSNSGTTAQDARP